MWTVSNRVACVMSWIAATVEFHDQRLELIRLVDQRRNQSRESVREKFNQIRRHPFIVVLGPRLLQIREKLRREPMRRGNGAESRARSHGQVAAGRAAPRTSGSPRGPRSH